MSQLQSSGYVKEPKNLAEKVTVIETRAIRMPELVPEKRNFDEEFAKRLADSIEADTLLRPPIVEDVGNGEYLLIDGRHRVHACREILGWKEIPCVVLRNVDKELAESIDLETNLLSLPLEEPQRRRAVRRLLDLYKTRHPAKTLRGRWVHGETYAKELETRLGVSPAQAYRFATTAEHIDDETRDSLERAGVTQTEIDNIAQLKDGEAIKETVNLTASGMDVDEALRHGKKMRKEKKQAAAKERGVASGKPAQEAPPLRAAEQTDDEWLSTHCSKILDLLVFKAAFKRDAILYRRIINAGLAKFRGAVKKPMAEVKKHGENGTFYAQIFRVVRAAHPMHWLVCAGCLGKGHVPDDKKTQCPTCLGGAYKVKFEET